MAATWNRRDPFWEGPRIAKSDLKAFSQHKSDVRTNLATKLWIETTLCTLPQNHRARNSLALRLDEFTPPHSRSSSRDEGYVSASPTSSTPSKKHTNFTHLPHHIRTRIYNEVLSSIDLSDPLTSTMETQRLQTLSDIHPILRPEITQVCTLLTPPTNPSPSPLPTLTTSFRINGNWPLFDTWFQTLRTENLSHTTTIRILLWTWHWRDGDDQDFQKLPDEIILTLDPSTSHITLSRKNTSSRKLNLCSCSLEGLLRDNGISADINASQVLDMPTFVKALRRGDETGVVKTIRGLANLVQIHDREVKRDSEVVGLPKVCRYCRGRRVYLTSFAS